jgi:foldase protein PrsA
VTRRLSALALMLVLAMAVAGCGTGASKTAMAQVGQTVITEDQFSKKLAEFEAEYAGQVPDQEADPAGYLDFQRSVLAYMVGLEVVQQKAAALNLATVTDYDVQNQIDQIRKQSFSGDQTQFDAALKQQNMTLAQLQQSVKEQLLIQRAFSAVTRDVTTVPEADVQAYYNAHKADFYQQETRTARHILIAPLSASSSTTDASTAGTTTTTSAPTQADWDAAKAKAEKIRAEIVAGADFAAEAKQYSDDPGTKDSGGELGTISPGDMVAGFDEAVFSLKLGEISQPVKTEYGYHIIRSNG